MVRKFSGLGIKVEIGSCRVFFLFRCTDLSLAEQKRREKEGQRKVCEKSDEQNDGQGIWHDA